MATTPLSTARAGVAGLIDASRCRQRSTISRGLFLGSDEGARVDTIFVSLLASYGIDPRAYLRDLFCLLRPWPPERILELAPAFWKQAIQQQDTQQRLAANVFRTVTLAEHPTIV